MRLCESDVGDESVPDRDRGRFRAAGDAELVEDARDVVSGGCSG